MFVVAQYIRPQFRELVQFVKTALISKNTYMILNRM